MSSSAAVSSLDDPDTRYRTREEIERVRNTRDPIRTLRRYIEDWSLTTEQELKQIDKDTKTEVDAAVSEAKESPEPQPVDLWADIYSKGNEPLFMRGRERSEVSPFAVIPSLLDNLPPSRFTIISDCRHLNHILPKYIFQVPRS